MKSDAVSESCYRQTPSSSTDGLTWLGQSACEATSCWVVRLSRTWLWISTSEFTSILVHTTKSPFLLGMLGLTQLKPTEDFPSTTMEMEQALRLETPFHLQRDRFLQEPPPKEREKIQDGTNWWRKGNHDLYQLHSSIAMIPWSNHTCS